MNETVTYRLNSYKKFKESIFRSFLLASAVSSIIVIFFIFIFLLKDGYPIFTKVGLKNFFFGRKWLPTYQPEKYGMFHLLMATFLVTIGAMVIAVPLSIGTAIFISEIAPAKLKSIIKPVVEILAGIPSVVYGFFGMMVLTTWIQTSFDQPSGSSWFAGSIILAIMALPIITSVTEDAISAIPREYKEGSLAVGATRWQTIREVILPASMSGITAAVILGVSRAIGETMAVMMVCGNAAVLPSPLTNIFSPVRTITATIGIETPEVAIGSTHYHALFGLALVLLLITLVVNITATIILNHMKEKFSPSAKKSSKEDKKESKTRNIIMRNIKTAGNIALILIGLWFLFGNTDTIIGILLVLIILVVYGVNKKLSVRNKERFAFGIISSAMAIVVCILGILLTDIISKGLPALSWEFISESPRNLGRSGGIYPAIVGTFYLVAGAILIALPLGVGAAIYLTEYTKEGKITKVIRAGVDLLNSTPSIVFGLFGFAFFVIYLNFGLSLIAGQITLAFMIIPTIIRTSEESLKTVPYSIREASLALGATQGETVRKVVLPPSIPGIITGVLISIGRAAGETAPIMFTAAVFSQRGLPNSIFNPVMALPYHLYVLASTVPGSESSRYGTALVLLLFVVMIYSVAIVIRTHYLKSRKW